MSIKIDQKEYLKKYLSSNDKKIKKKKSKSKLSKSATVKIIDDDANDIQNVDIDEELLLAGDDAPQIVAVIDERPEHMKNELEKQKVKWRSLASKPDEVTWGRKTEESLDHSPPRRKKRGNDEDRSPPRRRKDTDASPPRRRIFDNDDNSPPRRKKLQGREDSPHKRQKDHSPPRKIASRGGDDDMSPIRMRKGDHSPKRKLRERSPHNSPPQKRKTSPPRALKSSKDSSSHKKSRWNTDQSPPRMEKAKSSCPPDNSPPRKSDQTLDGKRAGLQSAKALRSETDKIREKESKLFETLSSDVSGRDAEVQVRKSKSYRSRKLDKLDEEAERKKDEHEKQKKQIYDRWGKGLKQIAAYESQVSDALHESSKPLARYSDDADLDRMLKNQERSGDPMLEYLRNKEAEKNKTSNKVALPLYKGPFPENRFNIRPGYRWDGLDRSNGYEKKWFDVQNQKQAMQEEAYRYSTEDM